MAASALVGELFEGRVDIVGDVHGELDVLRALMVRLGYDVRGRHPDGRRLVFLGDLCDGGPDSPGVIELVRSLVDDGRAQCILGNHELNLLRDDMKDRNAWYFGPAHPTFEKESAHSRRAPANHTYRDFLAALPVALERADLRLVHAAWVPGAIDALKRSSETTLEVFERHESALHQQLGQPGGIAALAKDEKERNKAALLDRARQPPLLANLGRYQELEQMLNPVRVLTSGPERLAEVPFWSSGKWRMCDRVTWWSEYTDDVPVIVGHYWRLADDAGALGAASGGKPNLFAEHPSHAWVGAKQNVFCVDFSIGGRHQERADGPTPFRTRLAAVRWPEQQLVFAEGEARAMAPHLAPAGPRFSLS